MSFFSSKPKRKIVLVLMADHDGCVGELFSPEWERAQLDTQYSEYRRRYEKSHIEAKRKAVLEDFYALYREKKQENPDATIEIQVACGSRRADFISDRVNEKMFNNGSLVPALEKLTAALTDFFRKKSVFHYFTTIKLVKWLMADKDNSVPAGTTWEECANQDERVDTAKPHLVHSGTGEGKERLITELCNHISDEVDAQEIVVYFPDDTGNILDETEYRLSHDNRLEVLPYASVHGRRYATHEHFPTSYFTIAARDTERQLSNAHVDLSLLDYSRTAVRLTSGQIKAMSYRGIEAYFNELLKAIVQSVGKKTAQEQKLPLLIYRVVLIILRKEFIAPTIKRKFILYALRYYRELLKTNPSIDNIVQLTTLLRDLSQLEYLSKQEKRHQLKHGIRSLLDIIRNRHGVDRRVCVDAICGLLMQIKSLDSKDEAVDIFKLIDRTFNRVNPPQLVVAKAMFDFNQRSKKSLTRLKYESNRGLITRNDSKLRSLLQKDLLAHFGFDIFSLEKTDPLYATAANMVFSQYSSLFTHNPQRTALQSTYYLFAVEFRYPLDSFFNVDRKPHNKFEESLANARKCYEKICTDGNVSWETRYEYKIKSNLLSIIPKEYRFVGLSMFTPLLRTLLEIANDTNNLNDEQRIHLFMHAINALYKINHSDTVASLMVEIGILDITNNEQLQKLSHLFSYYIRPHHAEETVSVVADLNKDVAINEPFRELLASSWCKLMNVYDADLSKETTPEIWDDTLFTSVDSAQTRTATLGY